uniref:Pyrimidine dimer-specific glycosylase n=1 Tax=Chlorella virus TaxID=10507 RepID=Q9W8R1_9PHYC|nr:pyrimidine dimer-specific glycosylase [Chlorella virus]AAD33351.1 pyrimidine dimer-specific glycosylase [Chlorella virus]AAD33360.1 pyrimidine dimer-specific glycosylase [Chlorella virus]AAD33370.1 pyrimidine dimer-specific glycosylase [Chlorella virus]AAD33379.1 pyrimidine dimer-specific glycosylase [Chlorella virus]
MTRVNLVPVQELADQHLMAEFRELKMIPKALARSLRTQTSEKILKKIPSKFTLNTGHVLFFYDKGKYLQQRYDEIVVELVDRGYKINVDAKLDPDNVMTGEWYNDYTPTEDAFNIIRARIAEKIAMKPSFYRFTKAKTSNN